jgi:hypothetical protein
LTQENTASELPFTPTPGRLRGGEANATFGTLVAVAYAYEVSLAAFFEGTPTNPMTVATIWRCDVAPAGILGTR